MVSASPASRDPTGAPSPLEEQTETVSACSHHSRAGTPVAACALKSLAPSRWTFNPSSLASAATAAKSSSGNTLPPAVLWVFSRHRSLDLGKWTFSGRTAPRRVPGEILPPAPGRVRTCTPESRAGAPASKTKTWAPSCSSTSSPRAVLMETAIWLVIVPDGAYRAASLPSSSATYSSRRLIVGSSPKTSSPRAASNIACRIPGVGRVTVSLRRSIKTCLLLSLFRLTEPPLRGGEVDLALFRPQILHIHSLHHRQRRIHVGRTSAG